MCLKNEEYITCIGGANLDYTFRLEEKMVLSTSNPVNSSISYGGVIRNVADNLTRLNHAVSLMTVLGDDLAGEDLLAYSKKTMEVFACDKLKHENTGGYYSVINKEGNMDVGFADMSINRHMNRNWILEHKRHLNLSKWLIADTNITKDALEALIEYAQVDDKKLAIIGVSAPKMKHVPDDLNGVEILICNLDESQSYFNSNEEDIENFAKLWLRQGLKKVVITQGKKGAVYHDGRELRHQKAYLINEDKVIDVTGAGDAFSSAVLHGLINEEPLDTSIVYGAVSSSLTIQSKHAVNQKIINKSIKKGDQKSMKTYEQFFRY